MSRNLYDAKKLLFFMEILYRAIRYPYGVIFHLILLFLQDAWTLEGMRFDDLKRKLSMRDILPMVSKFLHLKKAWIFSIIQVGRSSLSEGNANILPTKFLYFFQDFYVHSTFIVYDL